MKADASCCLRAALFSFTALAVAGCGTSWESKFIRKRAKPPRPVQFEVAAVQRPYEELYKEHFNFWYNWHRELIKDLGRNRKREAMDIQETRRHLEILEKYLQEEQAKKVRPFVERFDQLTAKIRFGTVVSNADQGILGRRLESLGLEIHRTLLPKKMKEHLLPTPLPMDLAAYEGDEPEISPPSMEVKPGPGSADTVKDGDDGGLTYERYRTLPVQ